MYLSLQRRAIFPHRNFKKWSENAVFCTFWLENVLLATAACHFFTSQLQKVVWECCVLYILTSKCVSRYSGVPFFRIATSKSGLRQSVFSILTSKCASRYSGVQFFLCPLQSRHTKHWKTQHFATSLTFRACWSSFFPHLLIFFLAALLFQLSILSEVRLLNFLRLFAKDGSEFLYSNKNSCQFLRSYFMCLFRLQLVKWHSITSDMHCQATYAQ